MATAYVRQREKDCAFPHLILSYFLSNFCGATVASHLSVFILNLMKKLLLLLFTISFPMAALTQNTGSISGTLKTPEGRPVEGITILLTQGNHAAVSDQSGGYILQNIPLGSHTVLARGLGFKEEKREVVLTADTPAAFLHIAMTASSSALQEVEVLGRKETSYKSEYSFIGTKTASLVMDVPQTISTVTKELMDDQQAYRLTDVVKNMAGVTLYSHYDDMTVRGFRNGYESGLPPAERDALWL